MRRNVGDVVDRVADRPAGPARFDRHANAQQSGFGQLWHNIATERRVHVQRFGMDVEPGRERRRARGESAQVGLGTHAACTFGSQRYAASCGFSSF